MAKMDRLILLKFLIFLLAILVSRTDAIHLLERPCENIHSEELVKILMQNYSRSVAPGNPVAVQVEATIQDINELSVMSNSFSADLWFSAIWHDPRLTFGHLDRCRLNLSFDETFEKFLWSPNVCLVNTKLSRVHSSPKPNVLLMILANGTVWLNYRVQVEAPCQFHLSDFPMDSALCSLVFESYSYNTATVTINWMRTNAVTLQFEEISAADYQLTHTKHFKHTEYYKAGEWYRLTVEIGFRRRYGYYILQVYANMYLNVFLSWIAFCISLKALPARVILSVNTLMSICLQFGNIISSLPPVSYIKSIDVFMFTCIAFIFASLLELSFIAYKDKKMMLRSLRFNIGIGSMFDLALMHRSLSNNNAASVNDCLEQGGGGGGGGMGRSLSDISGMRESIQMGGMGREIEEIISRASSEDIAQNEAIIMDELANQQQQQEWHQSQGNIGAGIPSIPNFLMRRIMRRRRRSFINRGHRIDQISFILFPLAFSLFNAAYWAFYLSKRQTAEH